ncbi:MAG TPA: DUF4389 domain-containing protein [Streptosporangiaceae bacterium]
MADISLGAGMPPPPPPAPRTADEILLDVPGPARQRRLTVLVRWLLVIPHLIVLFFLGLAALVTVVICWFAALVIGRLPESMARFLVDYLRWTTRVYAYAWLLTDRYPPFTLADPDYPVRMSAAPGKLNRVAVLFRLIMVIPAVILTDILLAGLFAVGLVTWLIVLVLGRMPEPLHQAIAAAVRYSVRYTGYFYLMSATYPWWGLFGDQPGPASTGAATLTLPEAGPQEAGPPEAGPPDAGSAESWPPQGDSTAPSSPGWPAGPQPWRIVLSSGAKVLVGVMIGIGAVNYVTNVALGVSGNNPASRVVAIDTVGVAYQALSSEARQQNTAEAACQATASRLACATAFDRQIAKDLAAFANTVSTTPMPPGAQSAASQLTSAAGQAESALKQLATATTPAQYQQLLASTGLDQKLRAVDSDYQRLVNTLGTS